MSGQRRFVKKTMRGGERTRVLFAPNFVCRFYSPSYFSLLPESSHGRCEENKIAKTKGEIVSKENAGMRKNGFDFFFWTVDRANSKWKIGLTCCNFPQKYFQERVEEFEMALLPTQGRTTELISICLSFCLGDWKEEREWKIPFPFVFSASEMQKMSFYDAVDSLNPFSPNELEKERLKTGIGQQCYTSIFFGVGRAHFPTIA